MTINRTFRDSNGILWRVAVIDRNKGSSPVRDAPWLLFEAEWMQRRLSPIPENWETATDHRLEQMCRIAKPILRHERVSSLTPLSSQSVAPPELAADSAPQTERGLEASGISVLADAWPAHDVHISFRG